MRNIAFEDKVKEIKEMTIDVSFRNSGSWERVRPGDRLAAIETTRPQRGKGVSRIGVIEIVRVDVVSISEIETLDLIRCGFLNGDLADFRAHLSKKFRKRASDAFEARRIEFGYCVGSGQSERIVFPYSAASETELVPFRAQF